MFNIRNKSGEESVQGSRYMQEFRPTFADSSIRYKIQLRLQVSLDRYSVLVHVMHYIRKFDSYSVPKVLISHTRMRVLSYKRLINFIAYMIDARDRIDIDACDVAVKPR